MSLPAASARKVGPLAASALLAAMRLASPAIPVGAFSYSEGLEAAVDAGLVRDEAGARDWLADQLALVVGRADLPALAHAMRAWTRDDLALVDAVNAWFFATRETAESRLQGEQTGRALAEWLRRGAAAEGGVPARETGDRRAARLAHLAALRPAPAWPVGFALAAVSAGLPTRAALLACGFGWIENMAQAAMKAVPLGQAAGQRLIAALADALPGAAARAERTPFERMQSFAPRLAILGARHETQYTRLFRS